MNGIEVDIFTKGNNNKQTSTVKRQTTNGS